MKIEVEITAEQLQEAIRRSVKKKLDGWTFESEVTEAIKQAISGELGEAIKLEVRRQLGNHEVIKEKAEKAINNAIRRAIK